MLIFYNLFISIYYWGIKYASKRNEKAKKFIEGRCHYRSDLKKLESLKNAIYFHVASLGEFEQARPLIEKIKTEFPKQVTVLSFFSPSGYEIRKNYDKVDYVFYLQKDTKQNAVNLLNALKPKMVIFVKYEFWYHIINEVSKKNVPIYLIAASFRKEQVFFQWYGGFFRGILKKFNFIFTQKANDNELLKVIGIKNVCLAGDPRVDRVKSLAESTVPNVFMEDFVQGQKALIVGSGYIEEAKIIKSLLDKGLIYSKVIFAPHKVDGENIKEITDILHSHSLELYTEYKNNKPKILIINTIGILNSLYKYSYLSLVGGGFGKGIHNILEPAGHGNFIVFGNNFGKFPEASELIEIGGAKSIQDFSDLEKILDSNTASDLEVLGNLSREYINTHSGGTEIIFNELFKKQTHS